MTIITVCSHGTESFYTLFCLFLSVLELQYFSTSVFLEKLEDGVRWKCGAKYTASFHTKTIKH